MTSSTWSACQHTGMVAEHRLEHTLPDTPGRLLPITSDLGVHLLVCLHYVPILNVYLLEKKITSKNNMVVQLQQSEKSEASSIAACTETSMQDVDVRKAEMLTKTRYKTTSSKRFR